MSGPVDRYRVHADYSEGLSALGLVQCRSGTRPPHDETKGCCVQAPDGHRAATCYTRGNVGCPHMSAVRPAFILSLPRSGSTLLQRMIAAHSQVVTTAEPWLLLAPLYALRKDGVFAEYSHATATKAVGDFCDHLPGGRDDYLRAVGDMAAKLYSELAPARATVFLDKTPRYCMVVDELLDAFPDAHIIVLHRNPLAVLASISETWRGGRWEPYLQKADLYLALERVLAAQSATPERFLTLRYEDLIAEPERTLRAILVYLGLEWEPRVLQGFSEVSVSGRVGDPTGTVAYDAVSTAPLDKWRTTLASPVRKAWCRRYLKWIGPDRLRLMGYESDDLFAELDGQPSDWTSVPADALRIGKAAVYSVVEPDVVRSKATAFPRWRDMLRHT